MKRKILVFLLILSLILQLFSSVYVLASECYILSSWTETDVNNKLTVTEQTITFADMRVSDQAWVYKDFGSDYWSGDFQLFFDMNITTSVSGSDAGFMNFSNNMVGQDYRNHIVDPKIPSLALHLYNPSTPNEVRLYIYEIDSGLSAYQSSGYVNVSKGTEYFYTLYRDESVGSYGRLTLRQYTDEERQNLNSWIYLDLNEKQDFKYLAIVNAYGGTGTYGLYGTIGTVCEMAMPPSIDTDTADPEYNPYFEYFDCTITGNVTSDGGDPVNAGFYYKLASSGNWSWANCPGTFETGEQFEAELGALECDTTYDYQAYGFNEAGEDTGDVKQFTTSFEAGEPSVETLMYPIDFDPENSIVKVYGHLLEDGTENCTGWFQYREVGNETWLYSDNITDLVTNDIYSDNLTSISLDVLYEFKAQAENTYGIGSGGIGHFELTLWSAPSFDTYPVEDYTSTTAWIGGKVTDGGGDECWCNMQYRIQGTETWINTYSKLLSEGQDWLTKVENLAPSTTYQVRMRGYNGCSIWGDCDDFYYGDIVIFRTLPAVSVPVLEITDYGYLDDYALYVTGGVIEDGGSPATVWFEYRDYGTANWISNADIIISYGVETGYEVTHYIYGDSIIYGHQYEVRCVGENSIGTGYSSPILFLFVSETDTETEPPNPITKVLDSFLGIIGLNSTGGKLFFVILVSVVLFLIIVLVPGPEHRKLTAPLGVAVACLGFVLGMVIGYVPTMLTAGVLIAAAGTLAVLGIRLFSGGGRATD